MITQRPELVIGLNKILDGNGMCIFQIINSDETRLCCGRIEAREDGDNFVVSESEISLTDNEDVFTFLTENYVFNENQSRRIKKLIIDCSVKNESGFYHNH